MAYVVVEDVGAVGQSAGLLQTFPHSLYLPRFGNDCEESSEKVFLSSVLFS